MLGPIDYIGCPDVEISHIKVIKMVSSASGTPLGEDVPQIDLTENDRRWILRPEQENVYRMKDLLQEVWKANELVLYTLSWRPYLHLVNPYSWTSIEDLWDGTWTVLLEKRGLGL